MFHSLVIALASVTAVSGALGQAASEPVRWAVTYIVAGGIDGRIHELTLDANGALVVSDQRRNRRSATTADPDLVSAVDAFVATATPAPKPDGKTPVIPDGLSSTLRIRRGGREFVSIPTAAIEARLAKAMRDGLRDATAAPAP
jgi:hypothetical protein